MLEGNETVTICLIITRFNGFTNMIFSVNPFPQYHYQIFWPTCLPGILSQLPRENCRNSFGRNGSRSPASAVLRTYTCLYRLRVCKIYLQTNACLRGYDGGKMYNTSLWSSVNGDCAHATACFSLTLANRAFVTSECICAVTILNFRICMNQMYLQISWHLAISCI